MSLGNSHPAPIERRLEARNDKASCYRKFHVQNLASSGGGAQSMFRYESPANVSLISLIIAVIIILCAISYQLTVDLLLQNASVVPFSFCMLCASLAVLILALVAIIHHTICVFRWLLKSAFALTLTSSSIILVANGYEKTLPLAKIRNIKQEKRRYCFTNWASGAPDHNGLGLTFVVDIGGSQLESFEFPLSGDFRTVRDLTEQISSAWPVGRHESSI